MVKIIKRKTAMEFAEIKHLFTKNEEAFLNEIIRNPKFLERILLNSETLYNKLKKIIDNNKKIDKKTKKTLVKYLLRMASRPQPFRFNSGICLDQPNQFNGKKQIKKVEISLEWEQKLMKKVDDSLLRSTSVKLVLNPRLYMKDKQSILEKYVNNSTSYIYINNSEFIDELFELLKKPISLQDVLNQYRKDYDEKLIFDVIQKLIRVDIIKTELSSPSIDRDSDTFFEKIKQICGHDKVLISELEDIQYSLEMYKRAEIGEGICLYKDLINKMSSLCKSSSYVIVDLYLHDSMDGREEVISHVNVDDEMQILNLFDKRQTFDWESYYNSFISKYGFYTRVPLLHMIDRDEGLGLPQHLQLNSKNRKIEEYILNRIMQSNFKNDGILKLTSNDYRNIKDIYDNEEGEYRIPISYDCKMVPHEGRLILHPNAFSFPRNSFTGRFSFLKREKKWINVTKYSEINYTSNYFKDIGLTYRSESSTFIDCIGQTKNSIDRIPLNEIDMIAHNGRFYMVYQDEVIYPVSTHLVSYRNFNEHPALIFLNEFYRYCFEYPSDFPVDKFSFLEFIPRVDYKHFILSPARINIKFQQENTKEERINKINEMINNYNLNQFKYIYILEADRALPVPTNNNLSVQFMETCKQKVGGEYVLTLMEAPELDVCGRSFCPQPFKFSQRTCHRKLYKRAAKRYGHGIMAIAFGSS
ncbi:lantibiotic dehydratase, partial [Lentibacillus salicampi]